MAGPRILFSGYFGFGNFGDDAILYCMARQFKKLRPDAALSVLTQNPGDARWLLDVDTKKSLDIKPYRRMNPADIVNAIKNCDVFISGGGGLFQDTTSVKSVAYYAGLIFPALLLKKKVMIFSQGLGPLRSGVSKKIVARVLKNVHAATFRSQGSCALAKELSGRDFECAADPVFLLEPPMEEVKAVMEHSFFESAGNKTRVGIFLRQWEKASFFLNLILCLKRGANESTAYLFVPFQSPEDNAICREITEKLKTWSFMFSDPLSPPEMLYLFQNVHICFCMRYHSAVCAFLAGKPALGFSYDPKVRELFNDFGLSEFCLPLDAATQEMITCYEKLMQNSDEVIEKIKQHLPVVKERALKSFTLALEMV